MKTYSQNKTDMLDLVLSIDAEDRFISNLMLEMNAFVTIELAERITTLDKTTQYRERKKGSFPKLVSITSQGRRKAYRLLDLKAWIDSQTYIQ